MKMRMHSASGPSFQGLKNGQPYNKWVGTISLVGTLNKYRCLKYYWEVSGDTPEAVEKKLNKYRIGETLDIEFDIVNEKQRRVEPCKTTKK